MVKSKQTINTIDMDKAKDTIQEKAERFAEAHTYRLNNSYLTQAQKMEVELWYQFPVTLAYTVFCACLIYHSLYPQTIKVIIGIPLIINVLIGIINWESYSPSFNKVFFLSIGHNYTQWILSLSTIGILFYHHLYWWAALVLLGKIGLLALLFPSIFLYSRFSSKYKMHPKYAFFKKYYNKTFAFEENHEDANFD
jgi:hypothetical protein